MERRLEIIGKCITDESPVWVHSLYAIARRLLDERKAMQEVKKEGVRRLLNQRENLQGV